MYVAANANTMHISFAQDSEYRCWLGAAAHSQLTETLHDVCSFMIGTGMDLSMLIANAQDACRISSAVKHDSMTIMQFSGFCQTLVNPKNKQFIHQLEQSLVAASTLKQMLQETRNGIYHDMLCKQVAICWVRLDQSQHMC